MCNVGDIVIAPGMTLRVTEVRGNYLKCEYWNAAKSEWLPRGRTENRKTVEQRIADGDYKIERGI